MEITTRDKLLGAAEALMLAKGYPATTVDEICERAGVSKGSFYHFFSTKEELGLAVLAAFSARNGQVLAEVDLDAPDPVEGALRMVDHLVASAGRMWGGGCLLGSFALDLAETNPALGKAVSAEFRGVADMLARALEPLAGDGGTGRTAEQLAEHFIVVVEGALVLARAHGDWGYVERALEQFRSEVRQAAGAHP